MDYLIVAFAAFYAVLAIYNLRAAALLTLALLPSYLIRFQIFGLPITLLEIQIIILFLVWSIFFLSRHSLFPLRHSRAGGNPLTQNSEFIIHNSLLLWGIFFITFGGLVTVFVSPNWVAGFGLFRAFIFEPLLFAFVLFQILNSKFQIHDLLWPLGISASIISLFAIFQYLTGQFIDNPAWAGEVARRATSFFTYPNALSLFVAPICASFFAWLYFDLMSSRAKSRDLTTQNSEFRTHNFLIILLKALVFILSFAGIIIAASKGALIGFVVSVVVIFFLSLRGGTTKQSPPKKSLLNRWFIAVFIIILVAVFITQNSELITHNSILFGPSGIIRFSLWQETWQFLNTHWLFGAGWNGLVPALAMLHKDAAVEIYSYPHNLFLNFWATLGLSGLLGLSLVLFATFKNFFSSLTQNSKLKTQNLIIMAGLIAMIIQGLVDVPFFKNDLAILWWVFIIPVFLNQTEAK